MRRSGGGKEEGGRAGSAPTEKKTASGVSERPSDTVEGKP